MPVRNVDNKRHPVCELDTVHILRKIPPELLGEKEHADIRIRKSSREGSFQLILSVGDDTGDAGKTHAGQRVNVVT